MSTLPLFLRYLPKGEVISPTCSCTERLNSLTKLIGGSQLNQKFSFSFSKAHSCSTGWRTPISHRLQGAMGRCREMGMAFFCLPRWSRGSGTAPGIRRSTQPCEGLVTTLLRGPLSATCTLTLRSCHKKQNSHLSFYSFPVIHRT